MFGFHYICKSTLHCIYVNFLVLHIQLLFYKCAQNLGLNEVPPLVHKGAFYFTKLGFKLKIESSP